MNYMCKTRFTTRMGGFVILRILQKVSFGNILQEWFLCLINIIGSQPTNFLFYCIKDTKKASSTFCTWKIQCTASQHKPLGGGCCALTVISLRVLQSQLLRSSFVQFTIPTKYQTTATAYILIVSILLQACICRWDLSI